VIPLSTIILSRKSEMKPHSPEDALSPAKPASPISSLRFAGLDGTAAKHSAEIADDMLHGADAIAEFLCGNGKYRRRVYTLVDGNSLPVFRIGITICARKSVLLDWIAAQEHGNIQRISDNE
jgi:hypothetical protein